MSVEFDKTVKDILKNYKDVFDQNDLEDRMGEEANAAVNEIFTSPAEKNAFLENVKEMNRMHERNMPYSLVILAKMHVMDSRYEPYTLDSLLDIRHDTAEMKKAIRSYLNEITAERDLEKFNKKFFKPMADQMIEILLYKQKDLSGLPAAEQMKRLQPYCALNDGLFDSYSQRFANGFSAGYAEKDYLKRKAEINILNMTLHSEEIMQNDFAFMEGKVNSGDFIDNVEFSAMNSLAVKQKTEIYTEGQMKALSDAEKADPEDAEQIRIQYIDSAVETGMVFGEFDMRNYGLASGLKPEERIAMLVDPELRKQMKISMTHAKDGALHFKFMLGNLDMQAETPKADVNTEKLEDLRLLIADAYVSHPLLKGAELKDFSEASMEEFCGSLKSADDLLDDRTHWYNSSANYRNMQNSLAEVKKFAEEIRKTGIIPTGAELERLKTLTAAAKTAAETYLTGKDATGERNIFKNDYETKRVHAARAVRTMLDTMSRSLTARERDAAFRDSADNVLSFIRNHVEGFDPSDKELKPYLSAERLKLHDKAAAAMREVDKLKTWVREKNSDCVLPTSFDRSVAAYLSTSSNKVINAEKRETLRVMAGTSVLDKYAKEKLYLYTMNRLNELDEDQLDLTKHSLTEATEYSIAHIGEMIGCFDMNNAMKTDVSFDMTVKPEKEENLQKFQRRTVAIGGMGHLLVDMMASELNSHIPFDIMNERQLQQLMTETSMDRDELHFSKDEKRRVGGVYQFNNAKVQLESIPAKKEIKEITLDDFNGAVTLEDVKKSVNAQKKSQQREKNMAAAEDRNALLSDRKNVKPEMNRSRLMKDIYRSL